jgi:hypothetical protein
MLVWHRLTAHVRPYRWRPYVLDWASRFYTEALDKPISERRVISAWRQAKAAGLDRARPGEIAHRDAVDWDAELDELVAMWEQWDAEPEAD